MMRLLTVAAILAVLLSGCSVEPIPGIRGSYTVPLPEDCDLWLFAPESHVGERALALACPGIDLIRLFPWQPVQSSGEEPSWEIAPDVPRRPELPTPVPDKEII